MGDDVLIYFGYPHDAERAVRALRSPQLIGRSGFAKLVVAECRLILPESELRSQTTMSMTALKLRDCSIALSEQAAEVIRSESGARPNKAAAAPSDLEPRHPLVGPCLAERALSSRPAR